MSKQTETVTSEITMAERISASILLLLSESKEISLDSVPHVLDMSRSIIDLCMIKAKGASAQASSAPASVQDGSAATTRCNTSSSAAASAHDGSAATTRCNTSSSAPASVQDGSAATTTHRKHKRRNRSRSDIAPETMRKIETIQHMFRASAMMEMFLARQEDREVNEQKLKRIAIRIARAVFKDAKDINIDAITTDVYRDKDGFSVEIVMPKQKHDEK